MVEVVDVAGHGGGAGGSRKRGGGRVEVLGVAAYAAPSAAVAAIAFQHCVAGNTITLCSI